MNQEQEKVLADYIDMRIAHDELWDMIDQSKEKILLWWVPIAYSHNNKSIKTEIRNSVMYKSWVNDWLVTTELTTAPKEISFSLDLSKMNDIVFRELEKIIPWLIKRNVTVNLKELHSITDKYTETKETKIIKMLNSK